MDHVQQIVNSLLALNKFKSSFLKSKRNVLLLILLPKKVDSLTQHIQHGNFKNFSVLGKNLRNS